MHQFLPFTILSKIETNLYLLIDTLEYGVTLHLQVIYVTLSNRRKKTNLQINQNDRKVLSYSDKTQLAKKQMKNSKKSTRQISVLFLYIKKVHCNS